MSKHKGIYTKGKYIIVDFLYEYDISLSECATEEGLTRWADQLSEKTWMDAQRLREFIEVACKANNMPIPASLVDKPLRDTFRYLRDQKLAD